jgi:hypothetical protein
MCVRFEWRVVTVREFQSRSEPAGICSARWWSCQPSSNSCHVTIRDQGW